MWPQLLCVFFGMKYSKNVYIAAFLYVVSLVQHRTFKSEQELLKYESQLPYTVF